MDMLSTYHRLEACQELAAVRKVVQAAEVVLPRQRRGQIVSEFKHAAVIQGRRKKVSETEEGSPSYLISFIQ